jgi:hypothetical protein
MSLNLLGLALSEDDGGFSYRNPWLAGHGECNQ